MSDIIITPASGKIDFYQDLGAASLAKIELTSANDLSLSTTSGNLIIGDASRDIYIGNGINDVDIIFEQNGEIRPLPSKTLNIGTSGSFTQILASKVNINQNSFTNIPLDVYSSTSGATILNVAGTKGTLFSVTDNLSGSLMSVNNDAGLPVFEVFSDDRVIGGRFGQNDWIITSGGNIGIGTGVPNSKFHVVGTSTFNGDVSSTGSIIAGSGSAGNPSFEFVGDIDTGMFAPAANTIALSTSGVERVRIDNIGRVGIGTTTPSSQLHVVGSGIFTSGLFVTGVLTSNTGNFVGSLSSAGNNKFYYNGDNVNNEFAIYNSTIANSNIGNKFKIIPSGTNYGTNITLISNPNSNNQIIYLPTYNDGTLALTSDINTTQITGILSVSKGGTNTSAYSNGQLLIGSGTSLAANTLSAGTGIAITNGSGTISIAIDDTVVRTTGDQTINGSKTFGSQPTFNSGILVGGSSRFTIGAGGQFDFSIDRGNVVSGFTGDILKFDVDDDNGAGYSTTLMSNAPYNNIIIRLPNDSGVLARLTDITTTNITGTLAINKGGTGRTSYSNGQLLIGSGTSLIANTLTASTGISITNGSGTITIATTGLANYDVSVLSLGIVSGSNAINCGQDRQIQNLTLNGVATTFTKGNGWPTSDSVARETTLNIFSSGNTSVTWTIVNDWYRQPDSPLPSGRHIVLLRSIGSGTMQGHYIGNKTN